MLRSFHIKPFLDYLITLANRLQGTKNINSRSRGILDISKSFSQLSNNFNLTFLTFENLIEA